jgi:hypothetical protein
MVGDGDHVGVRLPAQPATHIAFRQHVLAHDAARFADAQRRGDPCDAVTAELVVPRLQVVPVGEHAAAAFGVGRRIAELDEFPAFHRRQHVDVQIAVGVVVHLGDGEAAPPPALGRHMGRQRFHARLGVLGDPIHQRHTVDLLSGFRRSARLVESVPACSHLTAGAQAHRTIAGGIHIAAGRDPLAIVELQKLDTSRGCTHRPELGVQQDATTAGLVQHGLHRRGHGLRLEHHAMPLLAAGRFVRAHNGIPVPPAPISQQ